MGVKNERPGKKPVSPSGKPRTKEEAIQDLVKNDPEKAAQLLREILKGK